MYVSSTPFGNICITTSIIWNLVSLTCSQPDVHVNWEYQITDPDQASGTHTHIKLSTGQSILLIQVWMEGAGYLMQRASSCVGEFPQWAEHLPAPLQMPSQHTWSALVTTHSEFSLLHKAENKTRIVWTQTSKATRSNKILTSTLTKLKSFWLTTYECAGKVQNKIWTLEFVLCSKYKTPC